MARDLNLVQLIGRSGSDAEVRQMPNGNSVANVSIAVGDSYTDKSGNKVDKTTWIRLSAFGKLADIFGQYVKKGKQIYVSGSLDISEYQDKQSGEKKYSTQVIVQNMQLLGGRDDAATSPNNTAKSSTQPTANADFDDDIPF